MAGENARLFDSNVDFFRRSETILSFALIGILVVLLVPLPPVILDMLLTVNLGLTVLLLLVVLGVSHPLDISVFPSLLLLMTLYRLSLNVATTRLVLLDGDAGKIVATFGGFVVGGNLVVGLVIFLILVIVQFIVITKGAGRVSEVAARFTLDALPGKQMAIDAELSAGAINETTARERRAFLAREAEFYGAMDGASKFVRGDAIAGLVVTAVNLVGGVILGVSGGLTIAEAATRYSILTIGDGLVSQIPALVIATAAGILVTKTGSKVSLSDEIGSQIFMNPAPMMVGGVILGLLALTPGLPKLPFIMMAGGLVVLTRRMKQAEETQNVAAQQTETKPKGLTEEDLFSRFLETDRACLEIGTRLIPFVESRHVKGLAERVPGLRQDLTRQHGIWVPPVRIRDNLKLPPETYRILIGGREVARGSVRTDHCLAIAPSNPPFEIEGEATTDPTFGLPAVWISPSNKQRAEIGGYTVVDAMGVVVTHLGEVLRRYAHELLSREDLQKLVNRVKETAPALVEEMLPDRLPLTTLHQVVVRLLEERVPITDMTLVLEATLNHVAQTKAPADLAEIIRDDLGRTICDRFRDENGHVRVIFVDPSLVHYLESCLVDGRLELEAIHLERLITAIRKHWHMVTSKGQDAAVMVERRLRRPLRHALRRSLADVHVIAYTEIPNDLLMAPQAAIRLEEVVGK
jgi:flagellar biosynthesis protein FlhA